MVFLIVVVVVIKMEYVIPKFIGIAKKVFQYIFLIVSCKKSSPWNIRRHLRFQSQAFFLRDGAVVVEGKKL